MSDERTRSRYVPPTPADPTQKLQELKETKERALKSPEFREALREDDAREDRANFNPDRGIFGQTGAGPAAKKTDPLTSQEREASHAQREEGYTDGES